jgi:tRNA-2-methylthio-N6-dimethylallyladenosine synthase
MPSVYIKTYGCQMNERDSEAVAAQLVAKGYSLAASEHVADVVLLNTCSVRDNAEQTALGKMAAVIGDAKKHRPRQVFGFLGCMAQSRGQELIDRLPDVDLVLGTQKFHRAADYLDEILRGQRSQIVDVEEERGSEAAIKDHLLNDRSQAKSVTAFVSIMQGCNQFCTFCIVPYTRGEERSRTIPGIVAECRELVARGVKEITLLGQIVTSYGKRGGAAISSRSTSSHWERRHPAGESLESAEMQSAGKMPALPVWSAFVQLIEAVHEIEGLERIRFTSPHPKGYGDDLVAAYGRLPKLAASAHLPVQSGSDRVLKLMHRGYTRARYLELIRKLRAAQPGMGITTDIIVGFPGETEADFEATLSLCREVQFDNAFLFKYSTRKGTPAASMPDQLPESLIEERHARVLELVNEIGKQKYEALVGQLMEILVEGPSKRNPARLTGRTRCNKIVVFEGSDRHRGQLMDVKITRVGSFTLYGDPAIVNL